MDKMRVLICDDLQAIYESYKERMEYEPDIECVGTASNSKECIEQVEKLKPDLLLLDIQMETKDAGIVVLGKVKAKYPDIKVIMLTGYDDDEYIFSAFANGADDYFVKELSMDELFDAMRDVYNNKGKINANIAQKLVKKTKDIASKQNSIMYMFNNVSKLSASEIELLKNIHNGKTYNQLAEENFVEPNSIRKKASRILKKCEAYSMNDLIKMMEKLGIFDFLE